MGTQLPASVELAANVFSANVDAVLAGRSMKRADLARLSEAKGGPTKKTIYNVLNQAHPPSIEQWAQIADLLDLPLWVLLIDGLKKHPELLKPGAAKGLIGVVNDYLKSKPEKRSEIEKIAYAAARTSALDK